MKWIYFLLLTFLPPDLRPYDQAIYELGSPKFAVREEASRKLRDNRNDAILPLLREATKSDDLEVKTRAGYLLKHHYHRLFLGNRDWPYIDCLSINHPNRTEVLAKYTPRLGIAEPFYDSYEFYEFRDSTFQLVCDRMDVGDKVEDIKDMLNKMWKNEDQWFKHDENRYLSSTPPEFLH